MIKKNKRKTKYGSFFLAMEAPGNKKEPKATETEVDDIDVDFTSDPVMSDGREQIPEELSTGQEPTQDNDININFSSEPVVTDPEQQNDDLPVDTVQGDVQSTQDVNQSSDDNPQSMDNSETSTEPIDSGDPGIEEDEINTDFGSDESEGMVDDGNTENPGDENSSNDSNQEQNGDNGPGLEYDSTRKYVLFKEYMSLYNALENYISKLESIIKDDMEINQIIIRATNNLREIRDVCYDYMTMKYEISTYVQSLVMYQKLEVAVQMVFNLLTNVNKLQNTNDKLKQ